MKSIIAWCFGGVGTYLEAQSFTFIQVNMPDFMQYNEGIRDVATTIGAIVGVGFLYIAYKTHKAALKEVEARTKHIQLNNQRIERELAADNTSNIVMQVLKEIKGKTD